MQGAIAETSDGPIIRPALHGALWQVYAITLLGVLAFSAPNLLDPVMRYDDFPALLAQPGGFWEKTLHEGRWLNYLWHLRGIVTPSWLNFLLYQMLWALFAAGLATTVFQRQDQKPFAIVLALMITVAPPATLISLWFNTLIPGLALVALYAWLGSWMNTATHRLLLLPFTVATFMAYTTYPLLLLAVCLVTPKTRSFADLAGLLALFVISFAAAVLSVYAMNLHVHGVFGVPLAEWRAATPAHDWQSLSANVPLIFDSFRTFADRTAFGFPPAVVFHLGLLGAATAVLLRNVPWEATYLYAGLVTGLALIVVQILKMGADVPPRGFIFAWVFYAVIIVRAAQVLHTRSPLGARLARNAVLLVLGSYMLQTFQQYGGYRPWQAETRDLAKTIAALDGAPVTLIGDVMQMPSAQQAFVQNPLGLAFRMEQITGRTVALCQDARCPAAQGSVLIDLSAN